MTTGRPFFDRFNAFIDGGWLGRLPPVALAVWMVYLRHADAAGASWPGGKRIASAIGHGQTRHIRKHRKLLVSLGLLIEETVGGGRAPSKYTVCVPTGDQIGPRSESDPGPNQPPQGGPNRRTQGGPNRRTEGAHRRGIVKGHSAQHTAEPLGFTRFWSEWPKHRRKVNKAGCLRFWQAQELEPMADAIAIAVRADKASHDWTKENGQYVPLPMTWLNQRRWEAPAQEGAATEGSGAGGMEWVTTGARRTPTAEELAMITQPPGPGDAIEQDAKEAVGQ